MCLRHLVYHSIFLHLLPSMYDFIGDFINKLILHYHSKCTYISNVHTMLMNFLLFLTAYDTT